MNRDVDRIIAEISKALPGVAWEQLKVCHPGADDDGIWLSRHTGRSGEVQIVGDGARLPGRCWQGMLRTVPGLPVPGLLGLVNCLNIAA